MPPKNIWGLCWRISLAQPCLVQIGFCLRKLHSTVGSSRRSWKEVNIGKLQKPPGITWPAPHRPSSCGPETSPVLRGCCGARRRKGGACRGVAGRLLGRSHHPNGISNSIFFWMFERWVLLVSLDVSNPFHIFWTNIFLWLNPTIWRQKTYIPPPILLLYITLCPPCFFAETGYRRRPSISQAWSISPKCCC